MAVLLIDEQSRVIERAEKIERIDWKGKSNVIKITREDGFVYYNESFPRDQYQIVESSSPDAGVRPLEYIYDEGKLTKNPEFTYTVFNEQTQDMITFDVNDVEISRTSMQ